MLFCIQQWLTAQCDQHKCAILPLRQLGKSALPRKKADQDWTKVMVDHKTFSVVHERSFEYCQGACIGIGINFHRLWDKWFALVGGSSTIVGQCISSSTLYLHQVLLLACIIHGRKWHESLTRVWRILHSTILKGVSTLCGFQWHPGW